MKASDFLKSEYYKKFIDENWNAKVLMLHCRHATQGEPTKNFNNHPLESPKFVSVHNGIIRDDIEKIFEIVQGEWDKRIETDSYLINKIAEVYGFGAVPSIDGSIATIAYDKENKKLLLFRNTEHNSIYGGYSEEHGLLVFGSTEDSVEEAFKKKKILFGIIELEAENTEVDTDEIEKDVVYETRIDDVDFTKSYEKVVFREEFMEKRLEDYYECAIIPTVDKKYIIYFKESIKENIKKELENKRFEQKGKCYIVTPKQFEDLVLIVQKHKDKRLSAYGGNGYKQGQWNPQSNKYYAD